MTITMRCTRLPLSLRRCVNVTGTLSVTFYEEVWTIIS